MRNIDHDIGCLHSHELQQRVQRSCHDTFLGIEIGRRHEHFQVLVVLRHIAFEQLLVEPVRIREQAIQTLPGFQIKSKARGSERDVQIHQDHVILHRFAKRPRDIVGETAAAHPAARADERQGPPEQGHVGIHTDRFDDVVNLSGGHGGNDVVAHPFARQPAIERNIVAIADDDNLGVGIADLGQLFDVREHLVRLVRAFGDDQLRRIVAAVVFDGSCQSAAMDTRTGLGHSTVTERFRDRGRSLVVQQERFYGYPKNGPSSPS